jgi:O-antigen ligase
MVRADHRVMRGWGACGEASAGTRVCCSGDGTSVMLRGLVIVVLGVAAGVTALALAPLEPRFAMAGTAGVAGAVLLLCLGSPRRVMQALIVVIAVTMPFDYNVNSVFSSTLFVQRRAADQFVDHMVAVGGVHVTLATIAAAAVLLLSLFAGRGGVLTGFRIKALPASGAGLLLVSGLLSLINAADWMLTGFDLLREIESFLLFTLLFANLDRGTVRLYLHGVGIMVFAEGMVATIQYLFGASLGGTFFSPTLNQIGSADELLVRASGILSEAIGFAQTMEAYLPVVVALALVEDRRGARLLYLAAMLAGFAGVFASQSRASWIALPVPLLVIVLALAGKRLMSLRGAVAAVVAAVVIGSAALAAGPTMLQRLTGPDGGSAEARIPLALGALDLIEQYPLFGVGLNNYADALARHDRFGWGRPWQQLNVIVHNLYLWSWAETGTVGLCALFWYFASAQWQAARGWRLAGDGFERAIAVGVAMGLVAMWIHGLFDIGFRLDKGFFIVSAQIGLLAALPLAPARLPPAGPGPSRIPSEAGPAHRRDLVPAAAHRSLPLIAASVE